MMAGATLGGRSRRCRSCENETLAEMFTLGRMPPVNAFIRPPELSIERRYPLDVAWCRDCKLVQLAEVVPPSDLFVNYQHLSSASATNARHLASVAGAISTKLQLRASARVLEIGSNDGTLLGCLVGKVGALLGVDPARNLAPLARQRGVETVSEFFSEPLARRLLSERGSFDVILALNVVAHTPDVKDLLRGVARLLASGGTFVMEAVDVGRTILKGEFDTVYHEHVYCFSLTALVALLARVGLTAVDVEEIPTQGGSLRIYAQRSAEAPAVGAGIARVLAAEEQRGIRDDATYVQVGDAVRKFKPALLERLAALKQRRGRVLGLGAPARGVVILNYCEIGPALVETIIDDTPLKQGRLTPGVHIPVTGWEALASMQSPAGFLLLSWNFEAEMISKLAQHVSDAEVLIPFPELRTRFVGGRP